MKAIRSRRCFCFYWCDALKIVFNPVRTTKRPRKKEIVDVERWRRVRISVFQVSSVECDAMLRNLLGCFSHFLSDFVNFQRKYVMNGFCLMIINQRYDYREKDTKVQTTTDTSDRMMKIDIFQTMNLFNDLLIQFFIEHYV